HPQYGWWIPAIQIISPLLCAFLAPLETRPLDPFEAPWCRLRRLLLDQTHVLPPLLELDGGSGLGETFANRALRDQGAGNATALVHLVTDFPDTPGLGAFLRPAHAILPVYFNSFFIGHDWLLGWC